MKAELLRKRLLAAGQGQAADLRVPYAFEKRVMARLGEVRATDSWLLWNRVLWRCAGPCVALTIMVGAFSWFGQSDLSAEETLAADIESVIYAPLATTQEVW